MRRMLFEPYVEEGGQFANRQPGKYRGHPWHRKRIRRRRRFIMRSVYGNRIQRDIGEAFV